MVICDFSVGCRPRIIGKERIYDLSAFLGDSNGRDSAASHDNPEESVQEFPVQKPPWLSRPPVHITTPPGISLVYLLLFSHVSGH